MIARGFASRKIHVEAHLTNITSTLIHLTLLNLPQQPKDRDAELCSVKKGLTIQETVGKCVNIHSGKRKS